MRGRRLRGRRLRVCVCCVQLSWFKRFFVVCATLRVLACRWWKRLWDGSRAGRAVVDRCGRICPLSFRIRVAAVEVRQGVFFMPSVGKKNTMRDSLYRSLRARVDNQNVFSLIQLPDDLLGRIQGDGLSWRQLSEHNRSMFAAHAQSIKLSEQKFFFWFLAWV